MAVSPDLVIRISDTEEYRFDPKKFLNTEAIAVEKVANLTWPQVLVGLNTGQMSAVTAIVWLLRRRKDPTLAFADVQFDTGIEVIDPDTDERYDGGQPEPVEDTEAPKAPEDPSTPSTPSQPESKEPNAPDL
jgi:hypothetical protein